MYFWQFWHTFHLVIDLILDVTWILYQTWFALNLAMLLLLISRSQMAFIETIPLLPIGLSVILNYVLIVEHFQALVVPQIIDFHLFVGNIIFLLNWIPHRKWLLMDRSKFLLVLTTTARVVYVLWAVLIWILDLVLGLNEILRVLKGIAALHTI